MSARLLLPIGIILAVGALLPQAGFAQGLICSPDWTAEYKCLEHCGPCPSSGGSTAAPAAPATLNPALANAAQSIGYSLGQQLGKALFGDPAAKAAAQQAAQQRALAAQQNALAAQQLNNSGIYLLKQKNYPGAINEFQKALAIAPNDATILSNLAFAKQQIKDTAVAAQNSGALSQVLGGAPVNAGNPNFDSLTQPSAANPNASALSLVNLDSNVVDLRGTTKTSIDPSALKSQVDEVFANTAPVSAPPDKQTVQELDKQFDELYNRAASDDQQWKESEKRYNEQEFQQEVREINKAQSDYQQWKESEKRSDEQAFQQEVREINKPLGEVKETQQKVQDELKNVQPASSGLQPHN